MQFGVLVQVLFWGTGASAVGSAEWLASPLGPEARPGQGRNPRPALRYWPMLAEARHPLVNNAHNPF